MAASRKSAAPTHVPGPRRVSFAKIREPLEVPDLLALQTESFDWLLGNQKWQDRVAEALESGRQDVPTTSGLEDIFEEISRAARHQCLQFRAALADVDAGTA